MKTFDIRVLVTGFYPFAPHTTNPSGQTAEALGAEKFMHAFTADMDAIVAKIYARVFDVTWSNNPNEPGVKGAADELEIAVGDTLPHVVLCLGMGDRTFRVERKATDIDIPASDPNGDGKDNCGYAPPSGRHEFPNELEAYTTALPAVDIEAEWRRNRINNLTENNQNAGHFVCEDVFYRLMRMKASAEYKSRILRGGLIHMPMPGVMPLEQLVNAIKLALLVTLKSISSAECRRLSPFTKRRARR